MYRHFQVEQLHRISSKFGHSYLHGYLAVTIIQLQQVHIDLGVFIFYNLKQVAQLSQSDRAAVWVSCGANVNDHTSFLGGFSQISNLKLSFCYSP